VSYQFFQGGVVIVAETPLEQNGVDGKVPSHAEPYDHTPSVVQCLIV